MDCFSTGDWRSSTVSKPSTSHCGIGERYQVARALGHHRVHATTGWSTREFVRVVRSTVERFRVLLAGRRILRREAQQSMHELDDGSRVRHS